MVTASGWHPAIAYALLGRVPDGLPNPVDPDLGDLLAELRRRAPDDLARLRVEAPTGPWPHPVPADLRSGLGYAQLAALVDRARQLVTDEVAPQRVISSRPYSAEEQRLAAEVPPHHGN